MRKMIIFGNHLLPSSNRSFKFQNKIILMRIFIQIRCVYNCRYINPPNGGIRALLTFSIVHPHPESVITTTDFNE